MLRTLRGSLRGRDTRIRMEASRSDWSDTTSLLESCAARKRDVGCWRNVSAMVVQDESALCGKAEALHRLPLLLLADVAKVEISQSEKKSRES